MRGRGNGDLPICRFADNRPWGDERQATRRQAGTNGPGKRGPGTCRPRAGATWRFSNGWKKFRRFFQPLEKMVAAKQRTLGPPLCQEYAKGMPSVVGRAVPGELRDGNVSVWAAGMCFARSPKFPGHGGRRKSRTHSFAWKARKGIGNALGVHTARRGRLAPPPKGGPGASQRLAARLEVAPPRGGNLPSGEGWAGLDCSVPFAFKEDSQGKPSVVGRAVPGEPGGGNVSVGAAGMCFAWSPKSGVRSLRGVSLPEGGPGASQRLGARLEVAPPRGDAGNIRAGGRGRCGGCRGGLGLRSGRDALFGRGGWRRGDRRRRRRGPSFRR